jgi:hypothetical protein
MPLDFGACQVRVAEQIVNGEHRPPKIRLKVFCETQLVEEAFCISLVDAHRPGRRRFKIKQRSHACQVRRTRRYNSASQQIMAIPDLAQCPVALPDRKNRSRTFDISVERNFARTKLPRDELGILCPVISPYGPRANVVQVASTE